jgi:hypothetical protein
MHPGRSCLPELRSPAVFADHPPSVCTFGEMVEANTLPGGPFRGGPRDCARGPPRSPAMSTSTPAAALRLSSWNAVQSVSTLKRGEPLLLPLPCGLPYAVQRLGHALPGLSPVCALLIDDRQVGRLGALENPSGNRSHWEQIATLERERDQAPTPCKATEKKRLRNWCAAPLRTTPHR